MINDNAMNGAMIKRTMMNGAMIQGMGMSGMMMCMLFAVLILVSIALVKHLRKPAEIA